MGMGDDPPPPDEEVGGRPRLASRHEDIALVLKLDGRSFDHGPDADDIAIASSASYLRGHRAARAAAHAAASGKGARKDHSRRKNIGQIRKIQWYKG
mmetsp:Transcript_4543/g.10504  ORF Transcript_4543/g.10504 Transcript_4543/m.10504 type:complete len:97 (+) Transcript_4543:202-492(+)